MEKRDDNLFIFFLVFEDYVPKVFFTFQRCLKEKGLFLVPIRLDQLQSISSISEQNHIVVISSVINSHEMKVYNEKVRDLLKYLLRNKRLTFMLMSSFSKLSDFNFFSFSKNYFFLKYPLEPQQVSDSIARYYELKSKTDMMWPGGKRVRVGESL
jgi:hypothetical protein